MTARSWGALLVCGALFGLSYALVRVAVPAVGPVGVTAVRTTVGGAVLWASAVAVRQRPRGRPLSYLLLGALSAAVPFTLITVAVARLGAGSAAVLNATAPLFSVLIGAVAVRRWPSGTTVGGLLLAGSGVAAVMTIRAGGHLVLDDALGVLAGLVGAAVFAAGGAYAASAFGRVRPLAVAAGQQVAAAVLLLPVAGLLVLDGRSVPAPTAHQATALAVLGVLGSGAAFWLFYRLVTQVGSTRAASVNLLVPLFGVLWAGVLLGEPVPASSLPAMAATVLGLALVVRRSAAPGR